jgi:hypothetical protein
MDSMLAIRSASYIRNSHMPEMGDKHPDITIISSFTPANNSIPDFGILSFDPDTASSLCNSDPSAL